MLLTRTKMMSRESFRAGGLSEFSEEVETAMKTIKGPGSFWLSLPAKLLRLTAWTRLQPGLRRLGTKGSRFLRGMRGLST